MPDVDPVIIDAIDRVVERRKEKAEWGVDEMRSALMDVAGGESQSAAADERSFTQPTLSKRWDEVKEEEDQLRKQSNTESGLFRNPVEEAVEEFRNFFNDLNEKYDLGIRDRVIQMMVDEVRDARQLPTPMYLKRFLKGTSSGIQGTDVDYVQSRYESWLKNFKGDRSGGGMGGGGMGGPQAGGMGQGQQHPNGMNGGVPIGGGNNQGPPLGQQGGGQQGVPIQGQQQQGYGQQGYQNQPPQQRGRAPQQQSPPPRQGGSDDDGEVKDPRVDELREEVEQLAAAMGELVSEEEDNSDKVTVTTEEGVEMTMTVEQAMQAGYLGDNEPDFMEKLQMAKQQGVIPSAEDLEDDSRDLMETIQLLKEMGVMGEDEDESMAEAIGDAISELGQKQMQAQQQMSQNFQQVLQQMQEAQEEEEEDLTAEQVDEIIEEKLTQDETERLRSEMDEKFNRMMDEVDKAKSASGEGKQDTEFLKTDRQMDFREKQLEMLNRNIEVLPKALAESVREGLVPAMKEMQYMDNDGSNPFWSPPGQDGRGQPGYTPEEVQQAQPPQPDPREQQGQPQPEQQQRADAGQPQQRRGGAEQAQPHRSEPETDDTQMAQDEPEGLTDDDVQDLRSDLGLDDDADGEEVAA